MSELPSDVIWPPPTADVLVMLVNDEVDIVGISTFLHEYKKAVRIMKINPVHLTFLIIGCNSRLVVSIKGINQIKN